VDSDASDPDDKPFEVRVSAHFDGDKSPIVLDLADPTEAPLWKPGSRLTVDVAAFSFQTDIYPDESSYYASQHKPNSKVQFAANYFIPSGSFFERVGGAMPDSAARPIAYADFAGKVLKCELRTNAIGGRSFWWAEVATYRDATFDVVMDPSTLKREPTVGSIIAGRFWLTARLVPSN
jgi:hypothetical protein